MWAANQIAEWTPGKQRRPRIPAAGTAAVEFALLAAVFFSLVFGVIELARLMYIYNTVQEVTRRAAAAAVHVYPRDTANIALLKQNAVFRDSPGELPFATPLADNYIRIEYLDHDLAVIPEASWPVCASQNQLICMANPNSPSCIRFVQVRVCDPGKTDSCQAVPYQIMFPFVKLATTIPTAPTIVPVETLGYKAGTPPCPPSSGP
jgi:hypothetical protein